MTVYRGINFQDVNHVIPRHGPFKDGGCSNFSRQNIHEIKFSVSGMNDFTPQQLKQNFFDPWIETQFQASSNLC
jgi:hypothetical protein